MMKFFLSVTTIVLVFHIGTCCAHTIAAAEHNTDLEDCLDHFGKFVRTSKGYHVALPNFSKLSMSGLPRGTAGRKGSKAHQKKAVKTVYTITLHPRAKNLYGFRVNRIHTIVAYEYN